MLVNGEVGMRGARVVIGWQSSACALLFL